MSNVKCLMSNVKGKMSIRLNFCQSVPPVIFVKYASKQTPILFLCKGSPFEEWHELASCEIFIKAPPPRQKLCKKCQVDLSPSGKFLIKSLPRNMQNKKMLLHILVCLWLTQKRDKCRLWITDKGQNFW